MSFYKKMKSKVGLLLTSLSALVGTSSSTLAQTTPPPGSPIISGSLSGSNTTYPYGAPVQDSGGYSWFQGNYIPGQNVLAKQGLDFPNNGQADLLFDLKIDIQRNNAPLNIGVSNNDTNSFQNYFGLNIKTLPQGGTRLTLVEGTFGVDGENAITPNGLASVITNVSDTSKVRFQILSSEGKITLSAFVEGDQAHMAEFTLDGQFNPNPTSGFGIYDYTLLAGTSFTGESFNIGNKDTVLDVYSVPEPGSAVLGMAGLATVLGLRRRRSLGESSAKTSNPVSSKNVESLVK